MARPAEKDELLNRIVSCQRPVVVLRGPAACGKTTAALSMYRHFTAPDGRAQCLLLAPNAAAAAHLRRRLLEGSATGVVVSPQVMTFAVLAGRVLAAAGDEGRSISAFRRRLLLQRIVDELAAAGKIKALSAVVETPGLVVTLDRTIAELKRAAVEPEALLAALGRRGDKCRDLYEVYVRYQRQLRAANLYDVEGRMWQARDLLAASRRLPTGPDAGQAGAGGHAAEPPGLTGLAAIAADGFTDFTPTQLEMLQLAAGRLQRVLITLPHAADGRSRLWHWTARTLNNIRRAFGEELEEIVVEKPDRASNGRGRLMMLCDRLFDIKAQPCPHPQNIEVIAAAGADAEVAAVARRIKSLLLAGARPGSIAVLARSLEAYRSTVERIFAAHDIPVAPAPVPLTSVPIVRFALDVASLAPRFDSADVLRVIKSSYFRPQAMGDFDERTAAAAEMLIREGNVLAGADAYAAAAARLARRIPQVDEDQEQMIQLGPLATSREHLSAAADMLARLFALAEAASKCAATGGLESLLEKLQLHAVACGQGEAALVARDLRALSALTGALGELDGPAPTLRRLSGALEAVSCPPARRETVVELLDILDARAMRYDHVFLLGVSEGRFPGRFVEKSLIGQADRPAWAGRGVMLDSREDLTSREMLLFYLAVSRADKDLTLSYLESDASGRCGAAGSFLLSLLGPAGGLDAARVERIPPGGFIPAAEKLSSRRDAFNAAISGLFDSRPGQPNDALSWACANEPEKIARAAMGLWARHNRWRAGQCDQFDGRITDADLLARLGRRFGKEAVFSTGQLNSFGQCPWRFFAAHVLELKPLAQPQRRLEAVGRGIFCHNVLFRVMSRLRDECGGPVRLPDVQQDRLMAALDEAVAAESETIESHRPPYPVLWRSQRQEMHRDLRRYLLGQHRREEPAGRSIHFELGFAARGDDDLLDPASTAEPVAIDTPAGEICLAGKIDRVDRVRFAGGEGLLVIDYKTGSIPTTADIDAGRNLQLPLYSLAVAAMLGGAPAGGVFHKIPDGPRLYFSALKKARGEERDFPERLDAAVATAGRFVAAIRAGRFDPLPTNKCPKWCEFRQICHYSETRAQIKGAPAGRPRP